MPRFTLSQLGMGMALLAIFLTFTRTEGCGTRLSMIEALSFSSDDTRILVTKLTARDASTTLKIRKANVSRTVCWLDVSDGQNVEIVHQDYKPGNRGSAFRLWRVGRTSALCNPSTDHVAITAFGAGNLTCNVGAVQPGVVPLMHQASNLAFSRSGRFLAASGNWELTVFDAQSDTVAARFQAIDLPFLKASLMSFTDDETRIVVTDDIAVRVWDISSSMPVSTVIQNRGEPMVRALAVAPDDTVVVCTDSWVRRYDFAGRILATLTDKGRYLCRVSADGQRLAVYGDEDDELTIYDLRTNQPLHRLPFNGLTSLALSSNGDQLAVGDFNGRVTLIDTATKTRRWSSNPPGRYRWPWTIPAVFLVGWTIIAWRTYGCSARRTTSGSTSLTSST